MAFLMFDASSRTRLKGDTLHDLDEPVCFVGDR